MAKKGEKLKFLTQSVLLEEEGLPRINSIIIIAVFTIVIAFLMWSNIMEIDEVVVVDGYAIQKESTQYLLVAHIPSKEIGIIGEGLSVTINIPGITKKPLEGTIKNIENTPKLNKQGATYYEAFIKTDKQEMNNYFEQIQVPSLEANVEIILGNKTLFQNLLGPIYHAKENAFRLR